MSDVCGLANDNIILVSDETMEELERTDETTEEFERNISSLQGKKRSVGKGEISCQLIHYLYASINIHVRLNIVTFSRFSINR